MRRLLPLVLVGLGLLSACAGEQISDKPKLPYWIDGVCYACSQMGDKNVYWLAKITSATDADKRWLIESNSRQWKNLIIYIKHQKYMYESGLDEQQ